MHFLLFAYLGFFHNEYIALKIKHLSPLLWFLQGFSPNMYGLFPPFNHFIRGKDDSPEQEMWEE